MKIALPDSGVRRADVLLAGVTAVAFLGYTIYDFVLFPHKAKSPNANVAPALFGWSIVILTVLIYGYACLGVALGKRVGFAWMLVIGLLDIVGLFSSLLVFRTRLTLVREVGLLLPIWQTAYSVYRLWIRPGDRAP